MANAIPPLTQLQAYADWEAKNNPVPDGKMHIAQWAVMEIERLMGDAVDAQARIELLERRRQANGRRSKRLPISSLGISD